MGWGWGIHSRLALLFRRLEGVHPEGMFRRCSATHQVIPTATATPQERSTRPGLLTWRRPAEGTRRGKKGGEGAHPCLFLPPLSNRGDQLLLWLHSRFSSSSGLFSLLLLLLPVGLLPRLCQLPGAQQPLAQQACTSSSSTRGGDRRQGKAEPCLMTTSTPAASFVHPGSLTELGMMEALPSE